MKKRLWGFLFLSCVLFLSGCVGEVVPAIQQEARTFDFTLEAELDDFTPADQTKASATSVVRLSWSRGDEISVVNLTTGKALGGSLVADADGTITTFSGTLTGTVRNGDQVAFLYPSQGYTQEQDYEPVTIDFSRQGGQSKEQVPICVYAVTGASGNTFSKSTATFKFLMSYIQFSFANLNASDLIEEVTVDDMGSSMTLSLSSTGFVATPSVGTITLSPSAYSVSTKGTKSFYVTFAESPKVSSRKVTVHTSNSLVAGTFSGSKLDASKAYTATVADFVDAPITFADPEFKAYCVNNFDTDGDGEISLAEARAVTAINCSGTNSQRGTITSLDGIQYFTALQMLDCYNNQLTRLDLSKNTALTYLQCAANQLTSLDISTNIALTNLSFTANQLTNIDLSKNTALQEIYCHSNQLTSLDVSKNTALEYLDCSVNQLTSLDVSKNAALVDLSCSANQMTSLDVSKNTELTRLDCSSNRIIWLDVSNNSLLQYLYCIANQLASLDISNNTNLRDLACDVNQLTSLDVSKNTALEYLVCSFNQLSSLDVSNNTALQYIYCSNNQLTSLDVSNNTVLTNFECFSNQLTSLDVSNNTALTYLSCSPMETLEKVIMREGQIVHCINDYRDNNYIPEWAVIEYRGNSDMGDGGELED